MSENPVTTAPEHEGPIALDALAYGIDLLDAIVAFHLGDAHIHAAWVRPETGIKPDDTVGSLRDAYRVCQFASRRLAVNAAGTPERRGEMLNPVVTIELALRTAILRRVRSYVVACIFDPSMPLGMARLLATRLASALEPELPLAGSGSPGGPESVALPRPPPQSVAVASAATDDGPVTRELAKKAGHSALAGPPSMPARMDRVHRLLAYVEARAPEPHVARIRLALRAGLTLAALARPESLGSEALVLLETAAEDILGVDRAELRRLV